MGCCLANISKAFLSTEYPVLVLVVGVSFKISKNKNGDIGEKNLLYSPSYAKWYSVNL